MERLLIYFVYDKDGTIDDYILFALEKLRPFVEKLLVVANGKVCEKGQRDLARWADEVTIRPNTGFDVWAYKTGIESVGWDRLEDYDELILMNHTIMGPVYDLEDMFRAMESRDLDFWGITKCFEENDPAAVAMWKNPYGYIPEHIQSSFCAFRKRLFRSDAFHALWDGMPMIQSYHESGGTYEQVITKKFADLGYRWDCYTDHSGLDPKHYGCCPLITAPLVMVRDLKSPFFKRRSFFTSKLEFPSAVPFVRDFWDFLRDETEYDTGMVMKNMIRCCNQRDIVESLLLFHVIDV